MVLVVNTDHQPLLPGIVVVVNRTRYSNMTGTLVWSVHLTLKSTGHSIEAYKTPDP